MRRFPIILAIAVLDGAAFAQSTDPGKQQYQARCVGCHGEDGTGGGHGPSIVDVQRPRATTQEAMRNLIVNGIPDRGMPAFRIPAAEANAIAAYVLTFKPAATAPSRQSTAGDPAAGERFFAGKGNCASCHMVR